MQPRAVAKKGGREGEGKERKEREVGRGQEKRETARQKGNDERQTLNFTGAKCCNPGEWLYLEGMPQTGPMKLRNRLVRKG